MSDIVNEWLSVEAAAIRLGISSRSIARRVQSGQLESRVDANGRRSVLVTVPAAASTAAKVAPEPQVIPAEVTAALSAVDQTAQETGQTRAIVQQAMSVVIRSHEETVYAAREDAFSARRSMRRAWAAVALLFIAAAATVGIVTHNLTEATDLVHQADQRADNAERTARGRHRAAQPVTERTHPGRGANRQRAGSAQRPAHRDHRRLYAKTHHRPQHCPTSRQLPLQRMIACLWLSASKYSNTKIQSRDRAQLKQLARRPGFFRLP